VLTRDVLFTNPKVDHAVMRVLEMHACSCFQVQIKINLQLYADYDRIMIDFLVNQSHACCCDRTDVMFICEIKSIFKLL